MFCMIIGLSGCSTAQTSLKLEEEGGTVTRNEIRKPRVTRKVTVHRALGQPDFFVEEVNDND